ncbi:MAG TPA: WXG100 family type VII secretion target [Jatrophihabitans sp.]|uniref:WXG100 family type VII secretion target n=1 Tax=Jatrophihabitans sp. TaxID=1932789 RepID=UPI002DF9AEDE|nr:WXG100 family type VII secretion target [Jatrophihabitans sp.]
MSSIKVDLEMVEDLIARMGVFEQHVEGLLDDVDARMKRMHAGWTGVAAAEQAAAQARWTSGAHEMQQALAVLRSIATTARENYASAVAANVAMWG